MTKVASLACVLALAPASVGLAHGEFPATEDLLWAETLGARPAVHTNFGVLVPTGESAWQWLCEEIIVQGDIATLAIDGAGRWFVGGFFGLQRSDGGCGWAVMENALQGLYVTQVSVDGGDHDRLLMTTSTAGEVNALWQSRDGGASVSPLATFGEGSTLRGFVQGAGGLPIAVVGWRGGVAHLFYTADGTSWVEQPIDGTEGGPVFPLQVDPGDERVVWLRVDLTSTGDVTPTSRLLRAKIGAGFDAVLDLPDEITAFAVDPTTGLIEVGGRAVGMLRSSDGGQSFSDGAPQPQAACLRWRQGERYQCADNYLDGGAVLRGPVGEQTPLMAFGEVGGPLSCPEGSDVHDVCNALWPEVAQLTGMGSLQGDPTPESTPGNLPVDDGNRGGCGCQDSGETTAAALFFHLCLIFLNSRRKHPDLIR